MADDAAPPAPRRTPPAGLYDSVLRRRNERVIEGEGLRERKKRLTRQQISDTATGMFIERGFDAVRVADVAEACGVSEKTVYNYFPTKESLLLDREDEMVATVWRALGPDAPPGSPIAAVVAALEADITETFSLWDDRPMAEVYEGIRCFIELVESTDSLRAAQRDMMDRLVDVAAEALAERAGMDPDDPEPRIAAAAIVALWDVQFRAMKRLADGTRDPSAERDAIIGDIRRAARLIDTGLWSFNAAVEGRTSRQQLQVAAEAANEARKQVVVALKTAREAWRDAAALHDQHHQRGDLPPRGGGRRGAMARREAIRDAQLERQAAQRELQRAKQDVQREVQAAKREVQKAVAEAKAAGKAGGRGRDPRR